MSDHRPSAPVDAANHCHPVGAWWNTSTSAPSSGAAAAGVAVELNSPDGQIGHAVTDGLGNYRFSGLAASDLYRVRVAPNDPTYDVAWVSVDGHGSASWLPQPSTFLPVAAADVVAPTTTVYRPDERRTLDITVHGPSGAVLAGVEVRVYAAGGYRTLMAIARTDAAGHVSVGGLRPDAYTFWVNPGCTGCAAGGPAAQWYGGVVGWSTDGSGQLADTVGLLSADAAVTATLQ